LIADLLAVGRAFYFSNQITSLLSEGAGGVVGEGRHFPALRSEAGEAQPVARRAIVHKSTGV
jgi:hypothetical protein